MFWLRRNRKWIWWTVPPLVVRDRDCVDERSALAHKKIMFKNDPTDYLSRSRLTVSLSKQKTPSEQSDSINHI